MSRRIKGLPPRIVLQAKDHVTGAYPTIVRTGDGDRTGTHKTFFDDNETLVFTNRTISPFTTVEAPITNFHQNAELSSSLIAYWDFSETNATFGASTPFHVFHPDLYTGSLDLTSSSDLSTLNQSDLFETDTPIGLDVDNSIIYKWGLQPNTLGLPISKRYKSWVSGSAAADNFSFGDGTTDSPFSISMWIKRNTAYDFADDSDSSAIPGTLIPIQSLLSKSGSTGVEWSLTLRQGFGTSGLFLELLDDSSGGVINKRIGQFITGNPLELGKWHHIGISYDGSSTASGIGATINGGGIASATTTVSGGYVAMETTGQELTIGSTEILPEASDDAVEAQACGCQMTDIAFFNRVLTSHEFRKIHAAKRGINLPSGLPQDSKFLNNNNQTSMIMNSDHNKAIPDQFITLSQKILDDRTNLFLERFSIDQKPFNESFRPEQSKSGDFYLTGTNVKDSGLSFDTRLGSKLTFSREFSLNTSVTLPSLTASIHYFRPNLKRFFDVTSDAQDPSDTPINSWFYDAKLFGPLGTLCLSGAISRSTSPTQEFLFRDGLIGSLLQKSEIFAKTHTNHLLKNSNYSATQGGNSPHFFEMSEIKHPFLLEKVVLEMPFSASSDWFADQTIYNMAAASGEPAQDIGGPCITVSLMREDDVLDQREMICSGTIIPVGDNLSFSRIGNFNNNTVPSGFLSFSTPNVVLTADGDGGFNGMITLEMVPAISNGFYAADHSGVEQIVRQLAPVGRAGDSSDSGRSFFGKEYSVGNKMLSTKNKHHTASLDVNVFMGANSLVSPYLMYEDDKLVIAISKFRPAIAEGVVASSRAVLDTTHTVEIPTGKMNLRMYGSLIKESKESNNDWYNQPLTSLAVHEDIHGDNPITDQFDLSPLSTLSGSYVDNFITGSRNLQPGNLYDAGNFGDDDGNFAARTRGIVRSIIGTTIDNKVYQVSVTDSSVQDRRYEVPHMIRHVSMYVENSRFFDTYMPKFDDIYRAQVVGGEIAEDVSTGLAEFAFSGDPGAIETRDWIFEFPFEPKYAAIPRLSEFAKNILTDTKKLVPNVMVEHAERELWAPQEHSTIADVSGAVVLPIENRLTISAVFGFHNGFGAGVFNSAAPGSNWIPRQPIMGNPVDGTFREGRRLEIRGFKYGIYHPAPIGRRFSFRRDRFGQMRDMLEQSIDTKASEQVGEGNNALRTIVNPIVASFSAIDESSNIDTACSQSLPFFDDNTARN